MSIPKTPQKYVRWQKDLITDEDTKDDNSQPGRQPSQDRLSWKETRDIKVKPSQPKVTQSVNS